MRNGNNNSDGPGVLERRRVHVCLINASRRVFGAEKSLAYLVALTPDVDFSLLSPGGECEALFRKHGVERAFQIPIGVLQRRRNPLLLARELLLLVKGNLYVYARIRELSPDVIHANGIQSMLFLLLTYLLAGPPIVWHMRDLNRPRIASWICCAMASLILVPSRTCIREFQKVLKKTRYLPNPITPSVGQDGSSDTDQACREGVSRESRFPSDSGGFRIGIVGQIIPRKGHDLLLDALPCVLAKVPGARLHIIGDSPSGRGSEFIQVLRARVAQNASLQRRVFWQGYIRNMASVYLNLDLLVAPSREEAFGRVIMEAMRLGCPVIAARTGGLTEIIQHRHNGLLFIPGSISELSECIIEAAADPQLLSDLARQGRETYARYEREMRAAVSALPTFYQECMTMSRSNKNRESRTEREPKCCD